MPDCIFCRIINKEISSEIVYEDTNVLAFLDINPIAPGHTVMIPKKHAATILDLDNASIGSLFSTIKTVIRQIQAGLNPQGFNYGVNHGRVAGQAIEHLHIHILPRFENDGGGSMHSVVRNPPRKQTLEEIAGLLRAAGDFVQKDEEPTPPPPPKDEKKKIEEDTAAKLKEITENLEKHRKILERMRRP